MSTTLRVNSFHDGRMCSDCTVLKSSDPDMYVGKRVYVDLTVNGELGEIFEHALVGKTVEVDRFQPLELLGIGVRIKEEA